MNRRGFFELLRYQMLKRKSSTLYQEIDQITKKVSFECFFFFLACYVQKRQNAYKVPYMEKKNSYYIIITLLLLTSLLNFNHLLRYQYSKTYAKHVI